MRKSIVIGWSKAVRPYSFKIINGGLRTMENTTLKLKFNENLSENSIKMIKELLEGSLGFETEISRED